MNLWLDHIFLDEQEAFIYMVIWRGRKRGEEGEYLILCAQSDLYNLRVYVRLISTQ